MVPGAAMGNRRSNDPRRPIAMSLRGSDRSGPRFARYDPTLRPPTLPPGGRPSEAPVGGGGNGRGRSSGGRRRNRPTATATVSSQPDAPACAVRFWAVLPNLFKRIAISEETPAKARQAAALCKRLIRQISAGISTEYPSRTRRIEYQPDSRCLNRPTHGGEIIRCWVSLAFLEFIDGAERNIGPPCKLPLRPAQPAPRCSALLWCH
jgi:hypothetical protein